MPSINSDNNKNETDEKDSGKKRNNNECLKTQFIFFNRLLIGEGFFFFRSFRSFFFQMACIQQHNRINISIIHLVRTCFFPELGCWDSHLTAMKLHFMARFGLVTEKSSQNKSRFNCKCLWMNKLVTNIFNRYPWTECNGNFFFPFYFFIVK